MELGAESSGGQGPGSRVQGLKETRERLKGQGKTGLHVEGERVLRQNRRGDLREETKRQRTVVLACGLRTRRRQVDQGSSILTATQTRAKREAHFAHLRTSNLTIFQKPHATPERAPRLPKTH